MSFPRTLALAIATMAVAAPPALAQEDAGIVTCDDPLVRKPEEVTPAVGAQVVSLDAPVRVRYTPDYFTTGPGGDPTTLITVQRCPGTGCDPFSCMEDGEFVPGRVQVLGDELVFAPDEEWLPGQTYSGIARGVDQDLPFQFCTGTSRDTTAPIFGRLSDVTSTQVEPRCDALEGGYRIAAFFAPADDAGGPPGSIEYLLFQTRGADIDEPVLRSRVRNFATGEITMAFVLPPELASDVICVSVAAVDGVGNVTWSDENPDQDCEDPVSGHFFYGLCSASSAQGSVAWIALPLAAVWLVVRRRRAARR